MARPRSPDYDAQRQRMLLKATEVIASNGYASASMSDLARACGTSKAGLYHYFPSKDVILFESLDRYTRKLADCLSAVTLRGLPPRDEVTAMVRALLIEYRDSRSHHIALLNDVKFLSPELREPILAKQRAVVAAVADTIERVAPGRFAPGERTPATMALFGMINFTFAWLRPDGPMSYERYAELVIDLWERGVCEPSPEVDARCA